MDNSIRIITKSNILPFGGKLPNKHVSCLDIEMDHMSSLGGHLNLKGKQTAVNNKPHRNKQTDNQLANITQPSCTKTKRLTTTINFRKTLIY